MTRSACLIALLAAAAGAAPLASATAAVVCKGTVTSQPVADVDGPDAAWRTAVTTQYGADWADLSKAKDKRYYDINLALGKLYYMSAEPCRNVLVVNPPRVVGNKGFKPSP
jgi:hypothetical protein